MPFISSGLRSGKTPSSAKVSAMEEKKLALGESPPLSELGSSSLSLSLLSSSPPTFSGTPSPNKVFGSTSVVSFSLPPSSPLPLSTSFLSGLLSSLLALGSGSLSSSTSLKRLISSSSSMLSKSIPSIILLLID